jgi:hypothetical protein
MPLQYDSDGAVIGTLGGTDGTGTATGTTAATTSGTAADTGSFGGWGSAISEAAAITQARYTEWKNDYLPSALKLQGQTTYNDPTLVDREVNKAVGTVNQAYDTAAGTQDRYSLHSGVDFTPQQQAVSDRVSAVKKSASVVDAASQIRQTLADRNKTIMQSGISTYTA